MIPVRLGGRERAVSEILCLGAHADDIEIGCGATILRLVAEFPEATFRWVVLSADGERRDEAVSSAASFLSGAAHTEVSIESFPDRYFPWHGAELKDRFGTLARDTSPDLVLTHRLEDRHQDHRTVSELTWNSFRDQLVLEYEIPKFEGDLGHPNWFVPIPESLARRKAELLVEHFRSQHHRPWFDEETFLSLMRIRGLESNAPDRYAEAFQCRKIIW